MNMKWNSHKKWGRRALTAALGASVFACGGPAFGNDGAISYGGSPSLLKGHPTIEMKSERVYMTIEEDLVMVSCRFVFRNRGRATQVRMGFPDIGEGADDPDQEYGPDGWKGKPARSSFRWFKSFVDGKEVKTELIRSNWQGEFWHAKTVNFPAGATRVVKDVYGVAVGEQIAPSSGHGVYRQASYILHTGASWRGNIGRSEIIAVFKRKMGAAMLRPLALSSIKKAGKAPEDYPNFQWSRYPRGTVIYKGPSRPQVTGTRLRFVRRNWSPSARDDIYLVFGYRRMG